jgi:PPOX class probable F420-dependent enzyme
MRLGPTAMRERVAAARSARLATVDGGGQPHLVPVVFAIDADDLWIAVDHKPKSTRDLKRLRNIAAQPRVSVLVDHYDEDWARLWWVRVDGHARVLGAGDGDRPIGLLRAKYPQYGDRPPDGPVIGITVHTWRGWAASEGA